MKVFASLSATATPARLRAESAAQRYTNAFWSGNDLPDAWGSSLSAAGVDVTPELAMTLAAFYCGVRTIAYDLATLPLKTFRYRDDGGKEIIRGRAADVTRGGIRDLAYLLRWAPNRFQTSTEYTVSQVTQFLLRRVAYAEIVPGPNGFLEQLLPRHPDRVRTKRLPNGNLVYELLENGGGTRIVTQEEMHVVRDGAIDGFSTVQYGANTLGTALAAERAAARFFKSGMTASLLATYKGESGMEDEDEDALHKSISRYGAGAENSYGVLLVPDDVTVTNLAVEPDKAQMMLAREWSVFEVARELQISPRKLMVRGKDAGGYASAYQDAIEHAVCCIRPKARTFEQAIARDLIIEKDTYGTYYDLRELMQGDPAQLGEFIEKLVRSRAITPSEARTLFLDLNPDAHLDQLSERDNQPGQSGSRRPQGGPPTSDARANVKGTLALYGNAVRCLRRERAAVEKIAKKHPSDVEAWHRGLREFLAEHAGFVAQTMRIPIGVARGYTAQHGSELEAKGIVVYAEGWEESEADDLTALALSDGDAIDDWFNRRLVGERPATNVAISAPITLQQGPVTVDARTSVEPAAVTVDARTEVQPATVQVDARTHVDVAPAAVTVQPAAIAVNLPARKTEVHIAETARSSKVKRNPKDPRLVDSVETATTTHVTTKT
jgi:HK97 family phage portal protein